jgi:hypothetical protein
MSCYGDMDDAADQRLRVSNANFVLAIVAIKIFSGDVSWMPNTSLAGIRASRQAEC